MATFLIRKDQQTLREALLTAASLVAIARRFSTWVAANPTTPTPTDLYGQLEVPHGFHYFERTAASPVIDEAPTWHHIDEPPGTEPAESPHAAIVRQVVEDHTNTINLAPAIATAVTITAVLLRAVANYLNLDGLTPWTTWALGLATTLALALAFGRHVARRIGRTATTASPNTTPSRPPEPFAATSKTPPVVRGAGGYHADGEEQAQGVDDPEGLAPRDLLARVVAPGGPVTVEAPRTLRASTIPADGSASRPSRTRTASARRWAIRSQVPSRDQIRCWRCTVFQFGYSAGRARH